VRGSQIELMLGCKTPLARDGEDLEELVAKTGVCFTHLCEALSGDEHGNGC